MTANSRLINLLERLLLFCFCLFIVFSFYYYGNAPKIFRNIGILLWLLLNILKYKQGFWRQLIPANPLNKWLLIFILSAAVSTIFSLDFPRSLVIFKQYIGYYFFFFIIGGYFANSLRNIYCLTGAMIIAGIIFAIGAIWDIIYFKIGPYQLYTSFGFFGDPPNFGIHLVLYLSLAATLFFFMRNKIIRITASLSIILLFIPLIWSASRAAWLGIWISLLGISLFGSRKLTASLIVILLACGLFFSLQKSSLHRLRDAYDPRVVLNLDKWYAHPNERLYMLSAEFKAWKDYPVFGAGLGIADSFLYNPKYRNFKLQPFPQDNIPGYKIHDTHNLYMNIAAEMGICGLISFLIIFMLFFKNAFNNLNYISGDQRAFLLGVVCMAASSLMMGFTTSFIILYRINYPLVFWLFLGAASGLFKKKPGLKI